MTLLLLLVLLTGCLGAFLEPMLCGGNPGASKLHHTIVDVALDTDHKLLKFFINTKIVDRNDMNSVDVVVSDVNATTNRYTTFHSEIAFRGNSFVNENKRFCEMVGVKNDTAFLNSPRFAKESNTTLYVIPTSPLEVGSGLLVNKAVSGQLPIHVTDQSATSQEVGSFASSNTTIEWLYSNATGDFYSCPLYVNDSIYIYYQVDVSAHYHKIGSYTARFSIVSNNDLGDLLGCIKLYITPKLPKRIDRMLLIGVLVLILITGFINFLTIIYSSYQESSNPFLFLASTICNAKLLKQLDATVQRIIVYLQFALFTGGLNLNYPGFYQPIVSSLRWCALMGFNFIRSNDLSCNADNVYLTLGGGGLKLLAFFSSFQSIGINWYNFMLALVCWIGIHIASQLIFMCLRGISAKLFRHQEETKQALLSWRRYLNYVGGIVNNNFISLFGYPFLILTTFTFYLSNNINEGDSQTYAKSIAMMKEVTFSKNLSADQLFKPMSHLEFFNTSTNKTEVTHLSSHFGNITTALSNHTSHGGSLYRIVTERDKVPVGAIAAGSVLLAIWFAIVLYFIFKYLISIRKWKIVTNTNISKLYISVNTTLLWSYFYHHYSPGKTYFVIADLALVVAKSLVVSCAQDNGLVQVACMILIEALSCFVLFTVQPYYLPLTLTTTRWIIPVARFLIAVLCIPFIEELDLDENTRSDVAFVHLIIHSISAIFFVIQLFYCFITTVMSIVNQRREKRRLALSRSSSIQSDEFNKQFEYQPIDETLLRPHPRYPENAKSDHESLNELMAKRQPSPSQINHEDTDVYFRTQSEKMLQNVQLDASCDAEIFTLSSNVSFERQQEFSNKRKECVDYTFREGDLIYKRYFVDDNIDPEMKELWETRQKRQDEELLNKAQSTEKKVTESKGMKLKLMFKRKKSESPVTGFQVSRPKQIVVTVFSPNDDATVRSITATPARKSSNNTLLTGNMSDQTTSTL